MVVVVIRLHGCCAIALFTASSFIRLIVFIIICLRAGSALLGSKNGARHNIMGAVSDYVYKITILALYIANPRLS